MKKSRFTDEQMVAILREVDASSVPEVAKKHGVSDQRLYAWKKRFRPRRLQAMQEASWVSSASRSLAGSGPLDRQRASFSLQEVRHCLVDGRRVIFEPDD